MKDLKSRFRGELAKDLWTRISAVLLAIVIWFFVSVTLFPTMTRHISDIEVQVDLAGTSVETLGLDVIKGEGQTVSVKIKGNRYKIGNLKSEDLIAEVSLQGVISPGEYNLSVMVRAKDDDADYEISTPNPQTIKVQFDRIIEETFQVVAVAPDAVAAEGFMIDTIECVPSEVSIIGPQAVVSRIDQCVVEAEGIEDELTEPVTVDGGLTLYDENMNIIDAESLELSMTDFLVNIPVFRKRTVPLSVEFRNVPEAFPLKKLKYSIEPKEIEVAAPTDIDDNFNEIKLKYIDFRDINLGSEFDLSLSLPAGYKNISGTENIKVSFPRENMANKSFDLHDIKIVNAPSDYDIVVVTSVIKKVSVIGPTNVISDLSELDIIAEIDLLGSNITTGTQTVPVKIFIPAKGTVWAYGNYTAIIDVMKKEK